MRRRRCGDNKTETQSLFTVVQTMMSFSPPFIFVFLFCFGTLTSSSQPPGPLLVTSPVTEGHHLLPSPAAEGGAPPGENNEELLELTTSGVLVGQAQRPWRDSDEEGTKENRVTKLHSGERVEKIVNVDELMSEEDDEVKYKTNHDQGGNTSIIRTNTADKKGISGQDIEGSFIANEKLDPHTLKWFHDQSPVDVTATPRFSKLPSYHSHQPPPSSLVSQTGEEALLMLEFRAADFPPLLLYLQASTRDILPASYSEPTERTLQEGELRECEYQGEVKGVPDSWVALSICDGIRGVVVGGSQELLVEPVSEASTQEGPHRILSASLLQQSPGRCGVTKAEYKRSDDNEYKNSNNNTSSFHLEMTQKQRVRRRAVFGGPLWVSSTTRFVEVVLVADQSYYRKYTVKTRNRCRSIINIVNSLFRPLGIVVVLSDVIVWKDGDQIQVLSDHKQTLDNLKPYRRELLKTRSGTPNDNTVLLTQIDFTGSTVGYATVGGMCREEDSVAVVQDKHREVGVVAQTLAHEMGHNLNMKHDDDQDGCHCPSPRSQCLMSGTGSSYFQPNISWSSCSKKNLLSGFENLDFDCLKNVPTRRRMDVVGSCGDGVVDKDDGEECDCGPRAFCNNPCCHPETCKLVTNATCASGSCCDTQTCQPVSAGTVCREARSDCDLPEFCLGDNEVCPADVYKGDGASCRGDKGHCYKGECGSHEGQCQRVWGPNSLSSADVCYTQINTRGDSNGNCGLSGSTGLKSCSQNDVHCGTLHCQRLLAEKPKLIGFYSYYQWKLDGHDCSYLTATTSTSGNFWLSPDGAKCGDNKMCVNHQCRSIPAPEGDCAGGCSGLGVCNSKGHCHCNAGFDPPDCWNYGLGGSIDSGPSTRAKDPLWEGLFFLSLVLLGIIFLVCCLWERLRDWWDWQGRGSVSPSCPCCASCIDSCCCPVMTKATSWVFTLGPCGKKEKEVQREGSCPRNEESDRMICQVDLNLGGSPSKTNSWGVANERLVTEVVTMTPKDSPDFGRKIQLPSGSPLLHHKSVDELDRPDYMQSVSVDSGCVADEDVVPKKPMNSQMSMTSLVNVFRQFGSSQKSKSGSPENRRSRVFGSQKSMPLSRFVVDPLAGNRSSRQDDSPPSDYRRTDYRRSVSVDVNVGNSSRPFAAPPPPPATLKPHKSDDNITKVSKVANSYFPVSEQEGRPVNSNSRANGQTKQFMSRSNKTPMLPPQKTSNTQRNSPVREAPLRPTLQLPKKQIKGPMTSASNEIKHSCNSNTPNKRISPARGTPPPTGPPSGQTKRPMMPPGKGKSQPSDRDLGQRPLRPILEGRAGSSSAGAFAPPKTGPLWPLKKGSLKAPNKAPQAGPQQGVSTHSAQQSRVKDMAQRLEK